MKALLLSAGLGTRLGDITKEIPKVLVKVNNKPILQYHLENLKKNGITDIAINTHYMSEKIKEYFGDGGKFGVRINYSYEPKILGTSGSLNNFREYFNDTFLVIYADVLADFDIKKVLNVHKKNKAIATMVVDKARPFKDKGLIKINGEKVEGSVEKPKSDIPNSYINSGLYILEPEVIEKIPSGNSDFVRDIFPALANGGRVFCSKHEGYIFDIGTPEELHKAEEFLSR